MSDSPAKRGFTTAILHSDRDAPVEHGSLHKPLHLSVAYGYRELDASSLWVFLAAFGHLMTPYGLLVAYGLANVMAVLPITPGGLGVVEGVLVPTLVGFGSPRGIAIHRFSNTAISPPSAPG